MIHSLTHIHPNAKIAENVTIGPFVSIDDDVEISEGTWIGANVSIMSGARIGKNCRIFPGAVISAIPQDMKFNNEKTQVIIGENTTIRECVTINRGTSASYKTVIGNNCLIMAYSHIAHDCVIGNHCILANSANLAGHVVIDDWAIIGGLCAIHQFSHIGAHVMISGGSLVRKDIPPFIKAAREPLSFVGINSIGMRRRGFSNAKINEIQEIYRVLYLKGFNNTQAIEYVEANMPATKERDEIILFVKNSSRGIMKGYFPE